jgi:hypothetical protein
MRRMMGVVTVFGLLIGSASAQSADEAVQVIDKAIKAHFPKGDAAKETRNAYQGRNKGTLYVQGLELEFTQDIYICPPCFKEVMEMSVMNQNVKVTTVFNGKEGWIKANDKDIKVTKEILDEFKEAGYWMSLSGVSGLKDKSLKLSLVGETKVNGKPAIGVKVSKEGKRDIDLYFDKTTGLLAKTDRQARDFMSGQEVREERIIAEYQDIMGRKMAKRVTVNRDGQKLLEAEVLQVQILDRIADTEFAKP